MARTSQRTPLAEPARELVAYLCAEFGVDERLPIYAGGLGVLAGDHLKTASDLRVPLVAVGLLYREGYFRQRLDAQGQQHADPDPVDVVAAGLELVHDPFGQELRVTVPLHDHALQVRLWRRAVGRVPLFLLDTDCPENTPEHRRITARLYGGDRDTRLLQEIVLGIGGVRALRSLGLQPAVWHLNEGHAAFAVLERARELVANGLSFGASLEVVAAATVFTTHTPVPAGHDVFDHHRLHYWLGDYFGSLHTTERRLLALGADGGGAHRFSMTALALRGSRFHNAVSRIHRDVAARMEAHTWPNVPPAESPLGAVTNAVHLPTFLAPEWQALLDARVPDWRARPLADADCAWLDALPDAAFDATRRAAKRRLLDALRGRLAPELAAAWPDDTLVLGFARRFATYKRATLLLSDPARLARLLGDDRRPALLVFAGKAHPHDGGGQQLLRALHEAALRPEFRGRLVVAAGYDLALARLLVQGCDVWLNTPEYPLEASGTSGMKAGINGALNVSILDGWWAEGCDGRNGYGIAPVEAPAAERDAREAEALFTVLERDVAPAWFDEPAAWRAMSRHAMRSLIPRFGSARMLDDYRRQLYGPAAQHGRRLRERNCRAAVEFKRWKKLIHARSADLRVTVMARAPLTVAIDLNGLAALDLRVELASPVGVEALRLVAETRDVATFVASGAGTAPAQLRIVPAHPLMAHRYELGIVSVLDVP